MNGVNELEPYFREREEQEEYSGIVLVTQGCSQLLDTVGTLTNTYEVESCS